ncbi:sugar transferase [Bittarella massiliensis]|nr:sugar transferase [Bittarella massiliensis (ex Durand et al. 2017)]
MNNTENLAQESGLQGIPSAPVFSATQSLRLTPAARVYAAIKRLLDVLLSAVALVLLSPLLLLTALAVKLDSRGPAIFRQKRVGKDGKVFCVYKFRSMSTEAPKNVATAELKNATEYITGVGKVLRRTSLDELPQLWNVLRGDMSLVGPRPLVVTEAYTHQLRHRFGVYQLRPGITGLAQTNGRDLVDDDKKVAMDCEYLRHFSLWQDLKILFMTVYVVFTRKNYAEGDEVAASDTPAQEESVSQKRVS